MTDPSRARFPQPRFDIEIPIGTLRCSGGKPMERDLQSALKAANFPAIRFHFRELRGAVSHDIDSNTYRARVGGEISIAGAARPLELTATAQRLSRDRFRVRADIPLRMTDFGIAPPRALFGMVRAADDLNVQFDLILESE
jgi:polyisoprenoid-binding protein YceI